MLGALANGRATTRGRSVWLERQSANPSIRWGFRCTDSMAERRAARANTLIDALPQPQRDRLLRGFEPVEMRPGEILCEVDKPFGHAYFPRRGSISLVAKQGGHNAMAVGLIGCEGMLGESVVLGIDLAPIHALVQGPGDAWRIPVSRLRDALDDGATLGTILGQYLHVRIRELSGRNLHALSPA